jgi:hypothetical protein
MSKDSDEFMKAVDEAGRGLRFEGDARPFLETMRWIVYALQTSAVSISGVS